MSNITILGIRHHGVGSARYVSEMLKKLKPDIILLEGPPEMEQMAEVVGHKMLKPPVAVLCYDEAQPSRAAFYPFAEFSPEWVAMSYASAQQVPLRMMDLPVALMWQLDDERAKKDDPAATEAPAEAFRHPMSYLADIAGYDDSDLWWEHHFEQKYLTGEAEKHFEAVMLAMQSLRDANLPSLLDDENMYREAWMGNCIRKAQLELYQKIVVICGAWHGPALTDLDASAKAHSKVLKSLPKTKIKVAASWVPWTNERLGWMSGYGAGIASPGWYAHLWKHPKDVTGTQWLANVAQLFRSKKMDISTAHVIESVRLAEALAALRERGRVGLHELNEATVTVMCMGDAVKMSLIEKELIVGKKMGKVPSDLPKLPLMADFEETIRKLRIPQTESRKLMELDLRAELDLERSVFFYRLTLLNIEWARPTGVRTKGTFKEGWELLWKPEIIIQIVDRAIWGNTIPQAAAKYLIHTADESQAIDFIAQLIQQTLPANLFEVTDHLLLKINELSAVTADIQQLMAAIGPLSHAARYGNVRGTDLTKIAEVVEVMLLRVCVGLPTACYGLDEASAQSVFKLIRSTNDAVRLLEKPDVSAQWQTVLRILAEKDGITPIIRGCTTRLLFDSHILSADDTAAHYSLALSSGNNPADSAAWLEGFLSGSGTILLLDQKLWLLLYNWIHDLTDDAFTHMLPILRRTFSHFPSAERHQIGQKAKQGLLPAATAVGPERLTDATLGESALTAFDYFW